MTRLFEPPHGKGTIPWLLERYHQSTRYKDLAPTTKALYGFCAKDILAWSKKSGHPHVKHISRPLIFRFLEQFNNTAAKTKKVYIFLRLLLGFAYDIGEIEANPALKMHITEAEAQVHIWTDDEVAAMIVKADEMGLTSVGTGILLAAETGQRQGDVLDFQYGIDYQKDRFMFRQNKTKELMSFGATQLLKDRLGEHSSGLIVPAKEGKRYIRKNFLRDYTRVAKAAGMGHCKFRTLRHTAIVRLARAGCTHSEIASVSGHTDASVASILRRYLPRDTKVADNAISKLENKRVTDKLSA